MVCVCREKELYSSTMSMPWKNRRKVKKGSKLKEAKQQWKLSTIPERTLAPPALDGESDIKGIIGSIDKIGIQQH